MKLTTENEKGILVLNKENERLKKENIFLRQQLRDINKHCQDMFKCLS